MFEEVEETALVNGDEPGLVATEAGELHTGEWCEEAAEHRSRPKYREKPASYQRCVNLSGIAAVTHSQLPAAHCGHRRERADSVEVYEIRIR